MAKSVERIPVDGGGVIVISNHDDDPCSWIVRKYGKGLFGKRRELSRWFNDEGQARRFADRLRKSPAAPPR